MSETKNPANKRRATREFWKQHIESHKKSGLTQARYCRQNDLNQYTFSYHKSKLNKRDEFKSFLPVSVIPEQASAETSLASGVSLSFNDRLNIRLDVGFNSDTLRRVIDLLETR